VRRLLNLSEHKIYVLRKIRLANLNKWGRGSSALKLEAPTFHCHIYIRCLSMGVECPQSGLYLLLFHCMICTKSNFLALVTMPLHEHCGYFSDSVLMYLCNRKL